VGLADPHALSVVISCAEAFDRIGFPEGNFPLAHACLYLSTAPKSNTAMAFFDALKEVDREDAEVPNHLRDASRDAESFGHGEVYVYPHAYRDHWAAQQYLPTALRGRTFYIPSIVGYEGKMRETVLQKRELQAAVVLGSEQNRASGASAADGELLSWSAQAKGREGWFKRLESGRSALLLSDRNAIFKAASPSRQARILIPLANDGLLLWESLRRCPEGLSAALVNSNTAREALLRYAITMDQIEQPEIAVPDETIMNKDAAGCEAGLLPSSQQAGEWFSSPVFDHILIREPRLLAKPRSHSKVDGVPDSSTPEMVFSRLASGAYALLESGGSLVMLCSPPLLGERISRILREECGGFISGPSPAEKLREAEDAFFTPSPQGDEASQGAGVSQGAEDEHKPTEWNWDTAALSHAFESARFKVEIEIIDQKEDRLISPKDIDAWFDQKKSRWGAFMGKTLETADFSRIEDALRQRIQAGPLPWKWKSLLLLAKKH
jgi:putative ATPase